MYSCVARIRLMSVMGVVLLASSVTHVWAQDAAAARASARVRPAYPAKPDACYVQLRPAKGLARSEDSSVCHTVLRELNNACSDPPAYDTRHFNSSAAGLKLPDWKPLDTSKNVDILKWSLEPYGKAEDRAFRWEKDGARIQAAADAATVRLLRSDVEGINPHGGTYTVYRIENLAPGSPRGYNQARLIFSEQGERTPSSLFRNLPAIAPWGSDLIGYRGGWFLFGFDPDHATFLVYELSMVASTPMGVVTVCQFQHVSDRHTGSK
jgi:hypothetical protein